MSFQRGHESDNRRAADPRRLGRSGRDCGRQNAGSRGDTGGHALVGGDDHRIALKSTPSLNRFERSQYGRSRALRRQ